MELNSFLDGLTSTQRRIVEIIRGLADHPGSFVNGLTLMKEYAAHHLDMDRDDAEHECESLSAKVEPRSAYPAGSIGAAYRDLLELGQPWKCRYPLFECRGQIGDIHDDDPCGPEYLDVRLTPLANILLPLGKPPLLPLALINGARTEDGASFPCHNLHDLWIAYEHVRQNPSVPLNDLVEVLTGPDLAARGEILDFPAVRELYEKGEGELTFRGGISTEIEGPRTRMAISSLPPDILIRDVIKEIRKLGDDGRIPLYSIDDYSTPERVRIVVDCPASIDAGNLRKILIEETSLQRRERFLFRLADGNGQERIMPLIDCLRVAVSRCGPAWHRKSGDPVERIPTLNVLLSHGGYESPISGLVDARRAKLLPRD
jgi:DNA gyrase/topoisomerase IV subunit A